jgi:pimeloyl-ACP methyl ester carboxylesterase
VVLVDSSITRHRGTREAPPAPKSQTRYYPSLAQGMRRFRLRPPQPCANDYILAHIARHSLRASESGYSFKLDQGLFAKMVADEQPPLPDAQTMLTAITCPVGIIYGELSRFYPAETRLLLESLLPANRIKGIPKAHHHVFLDQPLAFIQDLQDLLKHMR